MACEEKFHFLQTSLEKYLHKLQCIKLTKDSSFYSATKTLTDLILACCDILAHTKPQKDCIVSIENNSENLSRDTICEILGRSIPHKYFTFDLPTSIVTETFSVQHWKKLCHPKKERCFKKN